MKENEVMKVKKTNEGIVVNGSVFLSKEQIAKINSAEKQIASCGLKIESLIRSAAENNFVIGQVLSEARDNFPDWRLVKFYSQIADITGLPESRVKTAMKIYEHFKESPDSLKEMSVQECMKLISPKEASKNSERKQIEYAGDEYEEFDWEEIFKQKPISKVSLNQYRITSSNDSELWIVKRGVNVPMKIIDVFAGATENPSVKLAHKKMIKAIQVAAEEFYSIYEKQEGENEM
ncbi:MAG: hypothetical protein ACTTHG_02960 [Treponemataceae bacterium]